jgi:hypothetical protein
MGTAFSTVTWPPVFEAFAGILQIFVINPFNIVMPTCLSPSLSMNAYRDFVIAVVSPFIGIVLVVAFYFLYRNCKSSEEARRTLLSACIRNALFLVFLFYPSICNASFRLLVPCRRICPYADSPESECESFLTSDYSIPCGTQYDMYKVAAACAATFIGVGLPLIIGIYIWRFRKEVRLFLDHPSEWMRQADGNHRRIVRMKSLSFLFEAYPGLIVWECFDMVRKLLLT